jgi:hypothetical protein
MLWQREKIREERNPFTAVLTLTHVKVLPAKIILNFRFMVPCVVFYIQYVYKYPTKCNNGILFYYKLELNHGDVTNRPILDNS